MGSLEAVFFLVKTQSHSWMDVKKSEYRIFGAFVSVCFVYLYEPHVLNVVLNEQKV